MRTKTSLVAALATIMLCATASTALAELCARSGGHVYVRGSCSSREEPVRDTTLCAGQDGRVRVRNTCQAQETEATKLRGSLCASNGGKRLHQRSSCRKNETTVSTAKLCLRTGGKLVARGECRASEIVIADMELPSGLVVQNVGGTFGRLPANARVVMHDDGVLQVIEGYQCGRFGGRRRFSDFWGFIESIGLPVSGLDPVDYGWAVPSGRGLVELEESWEVPAWADEATAILNGWSLLYGNKDHHVDTVAASLRPEFDGGTLHWTTGGILADEGFDDEIYVCAYYTALAWDSDDIQARPIHVEYKMDNVDRDLSPGKGTRTGRYVYDGTELRVSDPVAVLPRGFTINPGVVSDDRHLFQIGFEVGQDKDHLGASDGRWLDRALLRDNKLHNTFSGSYVTLLNGDSVSVRSEPFSFANRKPCGTGILATCLTNGESHGVDRTIVREFVDDYDYVVPMLTGFDLAYATQDQHVKWVGAWLDQIEFDTATGRLEYRVSTVLKDKNGKPGFRPRTSVTLLGLTRVRRAPQPPTPPPPAPTRACTMSTLGETCGTAAQVEYYSQFHLGRPGCARTIDGRAACVTAANATMNGCESILDCRAGHVCTWNSFFKSGMCKRRVS